MFISITDIFDWLPHYKYIVLFPLMVIGGPIVTVISGSLVAAKVMDFFITYVIIIFADLTGDSLYYAIGRWGGLNFIKKWGHYFRIDEGKVKSLENHFEKNGGKTLIFGKFTQAIGSIILVAAGAAKMPYATFFMYNFFTTIVKSLFFLLIGFYFLQIYLNYHDYSNYLGIIIIAIVLLIYLIPKYIKGKGLKGIPK